MKRILKAVSACCCFFTLGACENEIVEERVVTSDSAAPANLFHHQKQLTYRDSLHIRVLSWGGDATGSYLILVADSLNQHYVGNSFFRQGALKDVWVDDLDGDGMPEIGVVLKERNELGYGRLLLHELSRQDFFPRLTFPPFSEALGADYGGGDSIYYQGDKVIVREFDLLGYSDSLSESKRRRRLFYVLENDLLKVSGSEELGMNGEENENL